MSDERRAERGRKGKSENKRRAQSVKIKDKSENKRRAQSVKRKKRQKTQDKCVMVLWCWGVMMIGGKLI